MDHNNPVCSPDGMQIFFDAGSDGSRWRFDRKSGVEQPMRDEAQRREIAASDTAKLQAPGCDERTWAVSADGSRAACTANGEEVVIVNLSTRNEIDRIPFDQRYSTGEPYPRWPLQSTWSPDGHMLLVGLYGEGSNSTVRKSDFFLLDLATKTWTRAMSGNHAVWLPDGETIVYETPREMVPLPPSGKHRVWSVHLARFDVGKHTQARLTSGVTNNVQPTVCSR